MPSGDKVESRVKWCFNAHTYIIHNCIYPCAILRNDIRHIVYNINYQLELEVKRGDGNGGIHESYEIRAYRSRAIECNFITV